MMPTYISGKTTWKNLCQISRQLCNYGEGQKNKFLEHLVYQASNSIGGRSVACKPLMPHEIANDFNGSWLGYPESHVVTLTWTSATSGATLTASRLTEEGWLLEYQAGSETESWYLMYFLEAVEKFTAMSLNKNAVKAFSERAEKDIMRIIVGKTTLVSP